MSDYYVDKRRNHDGLCDWCWVLWVDDYAWDSYATEAEAWAAAEQHQAGVKEGMNKFTVKSRAAKGWAGCVEYVVFDSEQKEHGPFNTRAQANSHVAKMLGVTLKEALNHIED